MDPFVWSVRVTLPINSNVLSQEYSVQNHSLYIQASFKTSIFPQYLFYFYRVNKCQKITDCTLLCLEHYTKTVPKIFQVFWVWTQNFSELGSFNKCFKLCVNCNTYFSMHTDMIKSFIHDFIHDQVIDHDSSSFIKNISKHNNI